MKCEPKKCRNFIFEYKGERIPFSLYCELMNIKSWKYYVNEHNILSSIEWPSVSNDVEVERCDTCRGAE